MPEQSRGVNDDPPAGKPSHDVDTTSDLIAGWLGGAVGILVSNPLEVLKVRLQTQTVPSVAPERVPVNRVGRSSPPATATQPAKTSPATQTSSPHHGSQQSARPGLASLWRSEGVRFLFAGAAGPILGLAFIDSAFFGLYGRAMSGLEQDRQDPFALSRVFAAGAAAGGICAMLETPIEVVKCRAQVEQGSGAKLGSFKIASMIARREGLRGFYIGGLMTAIHDGISSGIFFWAYFVFRRMLRGEHPFRAADPSTKRSNPDSPSPPTKYDQYETGRILLAGGLAGALSAVIPYPFDIIKTRLQTYNFEARAPASTPTSNTPCSSSPSSVKPGQVPYSASTPGTGSPSNPLSIRSVARGIHADGVASWRYRYTSTLLYQMVSTHMFPPSKTLSSQSKSGRPSTTAGSSYMIDGRPAADPRAEKLTLRILGFRGFLKGIRPTVISSFVGSAATITTFELALKALGVEGGGGGGVG